jgi:hypothetical protein
MLEENISLCDVGNFTFELFAIGWGLNGTLVEMDRAIVVG